MPKTINLTDFSASECSDIGWVGTMLRVFELNVKNPRKIAQMRRVFFEELDIRCLSQLLDCEDTWNLTLDTFAAILTLWSNDTNFQIRSSSKDKRNHQEAPHEVQRITWRSNPPSSASIRMKSKESRDVVLTKWKLKDI